MNAQTEVADRAPGAPKKRAVRALKIAGNVFFALLMLLVAAMAFFAVRSKMTGGKPKIAGNYVFIVLSGSMKPTFDMGSVALVRPMPPEQIHTGDIITFSGFAGDAASLTTHRVIAVDNSGANGPVFTTRGDANSASDPDPVPARHVVGKVSAAVPYLGYFLNFTQTKRGLVLLIVIPGALLILSEAGDLCRLFRGRKKEQTPPGPQQAAEKAAEAAGKDGPC